MNGIRVGGKDYFRPDIAVTRAEFIATAMNAAGISPDSSGYITAYLMGYTGKAQTLPAGATLEVSFSGSSSFSKNSTPLASDLTLEPGKMYRINVDMTK